MLPENVQIDKNIVVTLHSVYAGEGCLVNKRTTKII